MARGQTFGRGRGGLGGGGGVGGGGGSRIDLTGQGISFILKFVDQATPQLQTFQSNYDRILKSIDASMVRTTSNLQNMLDTLTKIQDIANNNPASNIGGVTASKEYSKTIECMEDCVNEHLVDGNESGAANDLHLIGCAYRELGDFKGALEAFEEARGYFKKLKEVINVARCDQKIAHCLTELGNGHEALVAAQKSLDVFITAHDSVRETYSLYEVGKAQIVSGHEEEGLNTLDRVLEIVTESDNKDFEFIIEIERKMAAVLRKLGRDDEAEEIERRVAAVAEIVEEN